MTLVDLIIGAAVLFAVLLAFVLVSYVVPPGRISLGLRDPRERAARAPSAREIITDRAA